MTLDPDLLVQGPRGRRLCLEYALACAHRSGTQAGTDAATTVFWAAREYDGEAGGTVVFIRSGPDGDQDLSQPAGRTAADASAALDTIPVAVPTAAELRDALAMSVDTAMYWQPPDGADRLCAAGQMTAALRRVAAVIAAAPDAQWWAEPVATDDQWSVPWDGDGRMPDDVHADLRLWRERTLADDSRAAAERPEDPRAAWSGAWWSMPPNGLVHTTRALGADGPAGLWFVEDSLGWEAAVATPVDTSPARVIEIDGAEDWAQLCRRHPLEVTASRRHDWYRVTDRDGTWVIPDWTTVALEADGVHLTVRGYLAAATRLIDLGDGRASVLAGWGPDVTYWFRGVSPRPVDAQQWSREADGWSRGGPPT
ncbi:hypothetical protein [Microbacterium timonense]|uniref:hypothetical protein n=1 Tax=Microbacterium timonense TaxID=2086576 RepID=UPI000D0FA969|nr:hypothetical protein [Microbacterium timonense]